MGGVVIVGGSVGGLTLARELRAQGFRDEISVIDADPDAGYRRPALSKGVLGGTMDPARVALPWPADLDITRIQPARASVLDVPGRRVDVCRGDGVESLDFDAVVIATGSLARTPSIPGANGVALTLRSLADALAMRDRLVRARNVVIIGAGFLGLEIASTARGLGCEVSVLEAADRPLERVAGADVGGFIADLHARHGVRIHCSTQVLEVVGTSDECEVRCADGTALPADLLVAAVGSIPDTAWLAESGLDAAAGLPCDGHGRVLDGLGDAVPAVMAIGDASAWWNPRYERRFRVEHWTHAIEQGRHVAGVIVGAAQGELNSAPYFWSEQYDARIQSVGSTIDHDEIRVLERDDDHLLVAYGRSGTLECVTGINFPRVLQEYRPMVEARTPICEVC